MNNIVNMKQVSVLKIRPFVSSPHYLLKPVHAESNSFEKQKAYFGVKKVTPGLLLGKSSITHIEFTPNIR